MRVLLIDDSDTMWRIQVNQLKQPGVHEIFEAEDGKDGLEKLENNMPIESGYARPEYAGYERYILSESYPCQSKLQKCQGNHAHFRCRKTNGF
jgi:CheY-like chemotaxis protein